MEILQAIILGIIEGLTEFLPISSTGHLIVSSEVLGYKDTAEIFTVVVQLGAILAVIWLYRNDLWQKLKGVLVGKKTDLNFVFNWVIATLPALVVGYLLKDYLSKYATVLMVGITLILGGIVIWLIENYHGAAKNSSGEAKIESITRRQALMIGLYQVLALVPGVSRSGSTIMGGILSGVDRVSATAFSFYLSIPVIVLASGYQLLKARHEITTVAGGWLALGIGTLAAFITALFVIKWLLKYVSKHDFKGFAYYRVIFGAAILIVLFITQ